MSELEPQVIFRNRGLIDLRGVTTFGVCAKGSENPIGYFGTGLKYAIAICLREGLQIELHRGMKVHKFTTYKKKMRGIMFDWIRVGGMDLPFTTDLGKTWELWQAYRELYCNAIDEPNPMIFSCRGDQVVLELGGYTSIVVRGKAMHDIFMARNTVILESKPIHKFKGIELHDSREMESWVYYRGIRVYKLDKPSLYTYNILNEMVLTENRTLANLWAAQREIAYAITECESLGLIRQVLEAGSKYFESTVDYNWSTVSPKKTFNEVMQHYHSSGYRGINTTAKDLYHNRQPEKAAPVTIPFDTLGEKLKVKLRTAVKFWVYLRVPIYTYPIRITETLPKGQLSKHENNVIYITGECLQESTRTIALRIFKEYADMRYRAVPGTTPTELLVAKIVSFGEQLRGQPL